MSVELDGIVEFDFKFAEFYYLREFSIIFGYVEPKLKFFSNGILLYYKNRLITRYRPDFGEMIPYLLDHNTGASNYIKLFGFAELPENIPINASKTVRFYPYPGVYFYDNVGEDVLPAEVRRLELQGTVQSLPHARPTSTPQTETIILRR